MAAQTRIASSGSSYSGRKYRCCPIPGLRYAANCSICFRAASWCFLRYRSYRLFKTRRAGTRSRGCSSNGGRYDCGKCNRRTGSHIRNYGFVVANCICYCRFLRPHGFCRHTCMDAISAATARYRSQRAIPLPQEPRAMANIRRGILRSDERVLLFQLCRACHDRAHRIHNVGYDLDYGACRYRYGYRQHPRGQTRRQIRCS